MVENKVPVSAEWVLKQLFSNGESPAIDWTPTLEEELFELASAQGVAPVLYHHLKTNGWLACCPDALHAKLKNALTEEVGVELIREEELKKLLGELKNAEVIPLLIKGTPLSYTLYPTQGLRPRCDTDLLINQGDYKKATSILKRMGYKSLFEQAGDYLNSHVTYIKRDHLGVTHTYDLHRKISNVNASFCSVMDYETLIEQSVAASGISSYAKTLHPVDALLLACFHRAGHYSFSGERLIWLYDIHLLAEEIADQEFQRFCDKAEKLKIVTLCRDAIQTAKTWFSTQHSDEVTTWLAQDPVDEASASYLHAGRISGTKNRLLIELSGLNTRKERLRFFYHHLFPPAEYMLWRYHTEKKYLLPILYGYRWVYGLYILIRG